MTSLQEFSWTFFFLFGISCLSLFPDRLFLPHAVKMLSEKKNPANQQQKNIRACPPEDHTATRCLPHANLPTLNSQVEGKS